MFIVVPVVVLVILAGPLLTLPGPPLILNGASRRHSPLGNGGFFFWGGIRDFFEDKVGF